jgi:sugar lactone lactonase YvrE
MNKFLLAVFLSFLPTLTMAYDLVGIEKVVPLVIQKSKPEILRIDKEEALWILDSRSGYIQHISTEGKPIRSLIPSKDPSSPFREASDFVFDRRGVMIIADRGNQKLVFLKLLSSTTTTPSFRTIRTLDFRKLDRMAISHDDILAITTEKGELHIQSYDGIPLHQLSPPEQDRFDSVTDLTFDSSGVLWVVDGKKGLLHRFSPSRKWLGATSGFRGGKAIDVNSFGTAYVTLEEGKWKEVNQEGKILGTFGAKGRLPGTFYHPTGVALAADDALWVAEKGNNRLQLFRVTNGQAIAKLLPHPAAKIQIRHRESWECPHMDQFLMTADKEYIVLNSKKAIIEFRNKEGKIQQLIQRNKKEGVIRPTGLAVDHEGSIWISDDGDDKIKKISRTGKTEKTVGHPGKKEGFLRNPSRLFVRPDGSIFVSDNNQRRIQVFNADGLYLHVIGREGKKEGEYLQVTSFDVNDEGVAVIDNKKKSLFLFDHKGKLIKEIGNAKDKNPIWLELSDIASDRHNRIYVLDAKKERIRVFTMKGMFLADVNLSGTRLALGPSDELAVWGRPAVQVYNFQLVPGVIPQANVQDDAGNISLTWKNEPDSDVYRIYRSTQGNFFEFQVESSDTEYFDVDIVPGKLYRYALSGVNAMGYEGRWTVLDPIKGEQRRDVSLINIESVQFDPVFTAAYKTYSTVPFGRVTLKNNDDVKHRNIKISISLKRYTDFPTHITLNEIESGEMKEVPVTLTFNDHVLELTENTPLQADVKIHFYKDNKERIHSQNAPLTLYSRNAISWTDASRLSSFVTPRDLPVVDYSRAALQAMIKDLGVTSLPDALAKSLLLYESVNALGMTYVPDPKTPYEEVSGNPTILDYVQFPRETLRRKLGDCDDTTALMLSLLESIGVSCAIADLPGHILLMADVEETDLREIGFPEERLVNFDGRYWIPIETTKFGSNFIESWKAGRAIIKKHEDDNTAQFITLFDASRSYPPVTLKEKDEKQPALPKEKVNKAVSALFKELEEERYQNRVAAMKKLIRNNPSNTMLHIQLGMIHVEGGRTSQGKKVFESFTEDASPDVQSAAHNNLGNIEYLNGNYEQANVHYKDASVLVPEDGGILINRARVELALGDKDQAQSLLKQAKPRVKNFDDLVTDFPAELKPK